MKQQYKKTLSVVNINQQLQAQLFIINVDKLSHSEGESKSNLARHTNRQFDLFIKFVHDIHDTSFINPP